MTVVRDGKSFMVTSPRVVVAVGAHHSPAMLLASGIGPRADLDTLGIEVRRDLPDVGGHLMDHACVALDFTGTPELPSWNRLRHERERAREYPDSCRMGMGDREPYPRHTLAA